MNKPTLTESYKKIFQEMLLLHGNEAMTVGINTKPILNDDNKILRSQLNMCLGFLVRILETLQMQAENLALLSQRLDHLETRLGAVLTTEDLNRSIRSIKVGEKPKVKFGDTTLVYSKSSSSSSIKGKALETSSS